MPHKKFQLLHDNRTPAELARAILQHPLIPAAYKKKDENFQQGIKRWIREDIAVPECTSLLEALQSMARGQRITAPQSHILGQSLRIIAGLRKELFDEFSMADDHRNDNDMSADDRKFHQQVFATSSQASANLEIIARDMSVLLRKIGVIAARETGR